MNFDEIVVWFSQHFNSLFLVLDRTFFYVGGYHVSLYSFLLVAFLLNLIVCILWKGAKG